MQRRFQIKGEVGDIMVVDDYGHHPAEIKATLAAARAGWQRRVVTVFQPHRYSRTKALFDDFVTAFYQADHLVVMDIYAAGEEPISGVSAAGMLAEGIRGARPSLVRLRRRPDGGAGTPARGAAARRYGDHPRCRECLAGR